MIAPAFQRRLQDLADQAEYLAETYAVNRRLDPVAVFEQLPEHRVTCSFEHYGADTFDGLIEYVPRTDGFHVHCNLDRSDTPETGRARFTLAHELGHYQIDEHRAWLKRHADCHHPCFCFRSEKQRKVVQEREADHFASHVLLPDAWLRKDFGMPQPDGQAVIDVAQCYGISLSAAAIRLTQIDKLPCAAVAWAPDGQRQWGWMSNRVFKTYYQLIRDCSGLLEVSPTKRLLRDPQPARTILRGDITAEYWFPQAAEDQFTRDAGLRRDRRDIVIKEHAISLGRYGVLTFLCCNEWIRLLNKPDPGPMPYFWGM